MADIQYANAYTEVLDILKYISKEDYEKIPKSKIKVFEENSNKNYHFTYDENKTLDEQNVSEIAKMIIAILYRDYWATIEQNRQIKEDDIKTIDVSTDLDLDYNYNQGTSLEIYRKDNILKKIIGKIKDFFGF